MKWMIIVVLVVVLFTGVSSAGEKLDFNDEKIRISYSVGYQVGGDFLRQGKDINPEVVVQGVMDALAGHEPLMAHQEMRNILVDLQREIAAAQKRKMLEQAEQNLSIGLAFLAENGDKDGVKTLPSGLQYKVLEGGEGESPGATDSVTVHYRGTLIDGTEFDSSHRREKPATFKVNGVIAGWTEALQLMKKGDKWQLFIPPKLAYGDKRSGPIEPNSTLIFEVELLDVKSND